MNRCRCWNATGKITFYPATHNEDAHSVVDAYCDGCGYHFTEWAEIGLETEIVDEDSGEVVHKRRLFPMKCDQCQMVSINGVPCHESGCRNTKKNWNEVTGDWIKEEDEDEYIESFLYDAGEWDGEDMNANQD